MPKIIESKTPFGMTALTLFGNVLVQSAVHFRHEFDGYFPLEFEYDSIKVFALRHSYFQDQVWRNHTIISPPKMQIFPVNLFRIR